MWSKLQILLIITVILCSSCISSEDFLLEARFHTQEYLPEYDMQLCGCLKEELLDFAGREGILSGPIFITRRGTPVGRTTVTALIQSLAHDAQVEAGKCTPRCLRKLYLQTQERILHNISTLAREEYEKLLRSEQEKTGWNA